MFLPLVTNSRLPMTLAPVVRPTSCLSEPRYSTLSDITASGRGGAGSADAGAATHSIVSRARRAARSDRVMHANAAGSPNLRSSLAKMLRMCFSTAPGVTTSGSGDRRVGAALGHQREHLALARRELVQRAVAGAAARGQLGDDLAVERGAAVGDPAAARRGTRRTSPTRSLSR